MISAPRPVGRSTFIDALRGIAALWVVLFHFAMDKQFGEASKALPSWVVDWFFFQGHLGVWIFFVVSGFVMALAVEDRTVDAGFVGRFIVRRVMRLIPPYYASIVIVLALVAMRAAFRHDPLPWPGLTNLVAHLFFLEGALGLPEINVVYWTLGVEVQFYVMFALLLWGCEQSTRLVRRDVGSIEGIRMAVVAAVSFFFLGWPLGLCEPAPPTTFVGYWYAFLAGVLSLWSVRHGGAARFVLGVYCAPLILAGAVSRDAAPLVVACTASIIAVAGRKGRLSSALGWQPIQFIGLVSYSVYLLHDPLVTIVGSVTRRLMAAGVQRDLVGLGATLLISLAAAALLWRFVERPSQAWSRRFGLGRGGAAKPPDVPI